MIVESTCIIQNPLDSLHFLFRSILFRSFPRQLPSLIHAVSTPGPHSHNDTNQAMLSARLAAAARLRPGFSRLSSSSSSSSSQAVQAAAAKPIPAVVPQSPNHAATWSTNQRARPAGQSGPRFEQTIMDLQPNSLSAMELIANEPIRLIHGRKTACDGGKSATKPRDGIFLTVEGLRFFPPLPLFFSFSFCRCWTTWPSQDLH